MTSQTAAAGLILVVDDDPHIRKALAIMLRREQYQVLEASGVEELYAVLEDCRPDLIFLDVMLSGEDGFSVCQQLKAESFTSDVPVFLLTARGLHADVVRGFMCGAAEYVLKPFLAKDVITLVKKYVMTHPVKQR